MISKTLVKLIDQAVLPAFILVASKILGVLFVNRILNLSWHFSSTSLIYSSKADYVAANSYSSAFMFLVIIFGFLVVLFKALFFRTTRISPKLSAKLFENNLNYLVSDNFSVYSKAFVWLSYAWLTCIMLYVQKASGLVYSWVFYISLLVSALFTLVLIFDVEKEANIQKAEKVGAEPLSILDIAALIKEHD